MIDLYNDNDPAACAWLAQLMAEGLIPPGRVDNRSIADVRATDLAGLRRVHFFAGIGGWAEALRLADWPDWLPTWTGSPPCQPFSAAGKRAGRDDARHLGPVFVDLVRAGRPPVLFGEQVASSDAIGRAAKPRQQDAGAEPAWAWWDDLSLRLEAAGYAAWAAVVPAAGVGAPHIRERLFFGAVDLRFGGLADADGGDARAERQQPGGEHGQQPRDGGAGVLADAGCERRQQDARGASGDEEANGRAGRNGGGSNGDHLAASHGEVHRARPTNGFWGTADWLLCRDERWRPVEPGTFPLAHGVSGRVGLLRGYGNAIVPQAAAEFIAASREVLIETGIWDALRRTHALREDAA